MRTYGKTSEKLADFTRRIAAVNQREREVSIERDAKQRELTGARERLREAEIEAEMVVIDGRPVPKSSELPKLEAEVARCEAEVEAEPWAVKAEACRRKRAQLESEREHFARDKADKLLAELVPAELEATEALRDALTAVLDAASERSVIAQDLDAVVRVLPLPNDASMYRLAVRSDDRMSSFTTEVRRAIELLAPLTPDELLPADEEDETERAAA